MTAGNTDKRHTRQTRQTRQRLDEEPYLYSEGVVAQRATLGGSFESLVAGPPHAPPEDRLDERNSEVNERTARHKGKERNRRHKKTGQTRAEENLATRERLGEEEPG